MFRTLIPRLIAALAIFFLSPIQAAEKLGQAVLGDAPEALTVEISTVFSPIPRTGHIPMVIKLSNDTPKDQDVTINASFPNISFSSVPSYTRSTYSFSVKANSQSESPFLLSAVPELFGKGVAHGSNVTLDIVSPSLKESGQIHFTTYGQDASIAFSSSVLGSIGEKLKDEFKNRELKATSGRNDIPVFYQFDLADLPPDWRGFTSLNKLAMTETEYAGLDPALRSSLREWCRLGGILMLYTTSEPTPAKEIIGLGQIIYPLWKNNALEVGPTCDLIDQTADEPSPYLSDYESTTKWPLLTQLGEKNYLGWLPLVFISLFGLIVGPLNLFFLARSGRRHRIFFTTTVISLAACLLLLAVIFIQDGTGGKGHRLTIAHLQSKDAKAAVWQEQISRTGMLLSRDFSLAEPTALEPVVLQPTRWVKLKVEATSYSRQSTGNFFTTVNKLNHGGDWFQSRAEQGLSLRSIVPTRARIDLIPAVGDQPPRVISSIDVPLLCFFYRDPNGLIWENTAPIQTGQEVTLKKAENGFNGATWPGISSTLSNNLRKWCVEAPGHVFWAWSDGTKPSALSVDTLKSIEWESSQAFFFGEIEPKQP
jgi:hypothetical protein